MGEWMECVCARACVQVHVCFLDYAIPTGRNVYRKEEEEGVSHGYLFGGICRCPS
jgi:hypothetical protein